MSKPAINMEVFEQLLGRLNETAQRISKDLESQTKQVDQKLKNFIDQGERATERLIRTIQTEVRSQIASLQRDVEKLAARLNEIATATTTATSKLASKAAKPMIAAKKAPAKRAPAKKAATKTAATKRQAAPKSPATRLAA